MKNFPPIFSKTSQKSLKVSFPCRKVPLMISWHWLSRSSTFVWIFWARSQCLVKRWPDLVRPLPMWENYSRLRSALWRATRYTQNVPKNISRENVDTIFSKKYQLRKFGYNILGKISAPKIWIQYFRKNISPENLDTIFLKKYQSRKFGYNKKIVVSYSVKLPWYNKNDPDTDKRYNCADPSLYLVIYKPLIEIPWFF